MGISERPAKLFSLKNTKFHKFERGFMKVRIMLIALTAAGIICNSLAAINLNQLGFYPFEPKTAIVIGAKNDTFYITDSKNQVKYKGVLEADKYWDASDEKGRVADFSQFSEIGSYRLKVQGCSDSYMFNIKNGILRELVKSSLKSFFYNRSGMKLKTEFAGKWMRNAGHPDTAVLIHPAAANASRPIGTKISSPMGWYDAGDFGKYIVNSGISTYTLLAAYEAFPRYYEKLNINIPESKNKIPDIIDECLWNVNWMLSMQDTMDGGVYHKLTSARFCGEIMPESDTAARYILPKSTTATLDFAAVMAQTARILRKYESTLPGLADKCLRAALNAWNWARKNPATFYEQNLINDKFDPDVVTGEYRERNGNGKDEFIWAASELYITTKQDSFFYIAYPSGKFSRSIPGWQDVGTLGLYSLFFNSDQLTTAVSKDSISKSLREIAEIYYKQIDKNAYRISMLAEDYYWGSNSLAANKGILFVLAYLATGETAFKDAAINQMDYLLGRNPVGYSFVTGFGSHSPVNIHHRASMADGIEEPVPGFLVGGPNSGRQDSVHCNFYSFSLPAFSYLDMPCSYASNEVAINWSAPLVFLSGALEVLQRNPQ